MKTRFRIYEASTRGRRLVMASSADLEFLVPMDSGSWTSTLSMRAKPYTLRLECTAERLN